MSRLFSEMAFLRIKRESQMLLEFLFRRVSPGTRGRIFNGEFDDGRMLPVVHALGLPVEGVCRRRAICVRESERWFWINQRLVRGRPTMKRTP